MASSFSRTMQSIGNILMENVEKTIKRATLAGTKAAVLTTPVKTGRARTNWRVSFGKASTALVAPPNTPNRNVNREVAGARALIEAANQIARWKVGSGNIYIGNPVDYILDLDRGTSKQALRGMSVFAIAAARDVLKKGRLLKHGS